MDIRGSLDHCVAAVFVIRRRSKIMLESAIHDLPSFTISNSLHSVGVVIIIDSSFAFS